MVDVDKAKLLPVNAGYFTDKIREMAENIKKLDAIEDKVEIQGKSKDLKKLSKELNELAKLTQHMKKDIENKYPNAITPPPSSGC